MSGKQDATHLGDAAAAVPDKGGEVSGAARLPFGNETRTSDPSVAGGPQSVTRTAPFDRRGGGGRYEILREHGRGGIGCVYRAHDHGLGRDVAIKKLIARGNIVERRFLREASITARLEHPGIVSIHEAGWWSDGMPFYAMKLIAGRTLRDLIAERQTVEQRLSLLHHVIAVADAIAYAHGRNIIHRDLKPANVIVGDFGETVVIDWGLAKDISESENAVNDAEPLGAYRDDHLTSAGSVLGTPAYMSPEQRRGEPVDRRADVYGIGQMLWQLCSLQTPPPDDPAQRRRMLRRAGIDTDLIAILTKAIAADPRQRYRDAGALMADLRAFTSGARIAARRYSPFARLVHWLRRRQMLGRRGLVLATVAVVAITAFSVGRTGLVVDDEPCSGGERLLASTWNPVARQVALTRIAELSAYGASSPAASVSSLPITPAAGPQVTARHASPTVAASSRPRCSIDAWLASIAAVLP